jgi:hypothetical protein
MIWEWQVGNLWVPTKHSRDILQEAKGIIFIKSTQIRWFSRWSGGGGWSGRAEAQRRPRVSKLRAKGLADYHSSETVVEAPRLGARGQNKRATFTTYLLKKGELESSSLLDRKRAKGSLPEKKHHRWKRKITYSKVRVLIQKGGMKSMTVMMTENQSCWSQVHVTAFRGTELSAKKWV